MRQVVWLLLLLLVSACQLPVAPLPTEVPVATIYDWPPDTTPPSSDAAQIPATFPPTSPTSPAPSPTEEMHVMTPDLNNQLIITVVYDNNAYDPRLKTEWGFAALVEYRGHTILFDTGGDGSTLLNNMNLMEIDPTRHRERYPLTGPRRSCRWPGWSTSAGYTSDALPDPIFL